MSHQSERLFYWTPRAFAILFALFVSVFALDAFSQERSIAENLVAFVMHMIPTAIVAGVLYVAWRWELPGAVLFALLGLLYWSVFPHAAWVIAWPPVLIGAMFLIHWLTEPHGAETHVV
ncbi:MAG: hypothetical protein HY820_01695 [Acidobacteria bacterium]|nr:hypothetical protein [Acidobacteriota bacterium]